MKTAAWLSMAIAVTVLAGQPAAADPEARNHPKAREKKSQAQAEQPTPSGSLPASKQANPPTQPAASKVPRPDNGDKVPFM